MGSVGVLEGDVEYMVIIIKKKKLNKRKKERRKGKSSGLMMMMIMLEVACRIYDPMNPVRIGLLLPGVGVGVLHIKHGSCLEQSVSESISRCVSGSVFLSWVMRETLWLQITCLEH